MMALATAPNSYDALLRPGERGSADRARPGTDAVRPRSVCGRSACVSRRSAAGALPAGRHTEAPDGGSSPIPPASPRFARSTNLCVIRSLVMATQREKMLAGEMYDPFDPELVAARARARDLCQQFNTTRESEQAERRRMLRDLFGKGGDSVWMQPPFYCDYGTNIELGERVFFNFNCIVLDVCRVRIGDFTLFGPAVQIYTPLHPLNAEQRRREEFGKPIDIGSDVWVGGGAIILGGVTIGARAVIGAGSVVTRDVPEAVFAAGNPCRVIRAISE